MSENYIVSKDGVLKIRSDNLESTSNVPDTSIKNFFRLSLKCVLKSLGYNVFYVVFGLIQLVIFVLSVSLDKHLELGLVITERILTDGVILFFCTACICSSVLDYYFTPRENLNYPKLVEGLVFTCIPILMFIFVTVLYCGTFFIDKNYINDELVKYGTIVCFVFTVLYSLVFRSTQFSRRLK